MGSYTTGTSTEAARGSNVISERNGWRSTVRTIWRVSLLLWSERSETFLIG